MTQAITNKFPLLLPYGLKCLALYLALYLTFRYGLPSKKKAAEAGPRDNFPWKESPSLTAHRIVAFFAMNHWCYLGFRHLLTYDYNIANDNAVSNPEFAALTFVPAGYEIAQYAMGALLIWDFPVSLLGGSGPIDITMHLHHIGMLVVTACVLGLVKWPSDEGDAIVATHVAPIFLGAIELSSIPLQIVDLFHPKKSPHWYKFANSKSSAGFFPKLCYSVNEVSRILFAIFFLLVRGLFFPYVIAKIAVPDFYAEGSLPCMVLLVMSILFTLLQMYWTTLVFEQVKKALSGSVASNGNKDV